MHACDQKRQSSVGESYLCFFGPVAYDCLIQCENKYRCLCVWNRCSKNAILIYIVYRPLRYAIDFIVKRERFLDLIE